MILGVNDLRCSSARWVLLLIVMTPSAAHSEDDSLQLTPQGLGVHALWIDPDRASNSTLGVGLHLYLKLLERVYLVPTIDYWSSSFELRGPGISIDVHSREINLYVDLQYYFEMDRIFLPFVGISPFLYQRNTTIEGFGSNNSKVALGMGGKLGFDIPIGKSWEILVNLRLNLVGGADAASVNVGVTRAFFPKSME